MRRPGEWRLGCGSVGAGPKSDGMSTRTNGYAQVGGHGGAWGEGRRRLHGPKCSSFSTTAAAAGHGKIALSSSTQ